uniref:Uncharacterized protein n=1 Tax=Pithovirus LCDPAC01 TaxID=2506600 RepID=A0A481YQK0_9VIRU|nr:MAG: hypothetical protein LCDPAC01_01740 [Pithovirus LCDPAC01]
MRNAHKMSIIKCIGCLSDFKLQDMIKYVEKNTGVDFINVFDEFKVVKICCRASVMENIVLLSTISTRKFEMARSKLLEKGISIDTFKRKILMKSVSPKDRSNFFGIKELKRSDVVSTGKDYILDPKDIEAWTPVPQYINLQVPDSAKGNMYEGNPHENCEIEE